MLVYAAYFALNTAALVLNYLPLVLAYVYDAQIFLTPNEYGQLVVDFQREFFLRIFAGRVYFFGRGILPRHDFEHRIPLFLLLPVHAAVQKVQPAQSLYVFDPVVHRGTVRAVGRVRHRIHAAEQKPVNYNDYVKEQYMRMQGMYAPPRENPPDNPFREFGGRGENDPGDPFSEFGGKKDAPSGGPTEGVSPDGENKDGKSGKNDKNDGGDSPFDGF